jgi:hypothetical protein
MFSLGGRDKVDSAPQAEYLVHEAQLMQLSPNKPAVRDLSPTNTSGIPPDALGTAFAKD